MAQCIHLDEAGRRCSLPAAEESSFCRWHDPESLVAAPRLRALVRRRVFRLAAFILLVVFLLPLLVQGYRLLKSLLN